MFSILLYCFLGSLSFFPQLSNYTGMLLVGCFVPHLLKKRQREVVEYQMVENLAVVEQDLFIVENETSVNILYIYSLSINTDSFI